MKCDVIHGVTRFPTVYHAQMFDVIQSEVALQNQVH